MEGTRAGYGWVRRRHRDVRLVARAGPIAAGATGERNGRSAWPQQKEPSTRRRGQTPVRTRTAQIDDAVQVREALPMRRDSALGRGRRARPATPGQRGGGA